MANWMFRQLQKLAAHCGCELVKTPRLNAVHVAATDLASFSARSGFLRNRHGGGYHAERKVRRRVDALSRALTSVGEVASMTRFPALLLLLLAPPLLAQSPVTWQDTVKLGDSALTIAYKRQVTVTDSTVKVRLVTATSGIPNGPFHLPPGALCVHPDFTVSTLTVVAVNLTRDLETVQACKKRLVVMVKRSATKDATGRISARAATAEMATWPDITRFVKDKTVLAIYIGDDVTADEWGADVPMPVRFARLDSMALAARTRWPGVAVVIRAKPVRGELADYPWKWLTTAWAQYRGPHRDKDARTGNRDPQRWADSMVRSAAALRLGLILGDNWLDGGCGPVSLGACLAGVPGTAIPGTFTNAVAVRRFQTSAAELPVYTNTFLGTAGVCGSIHWRWSPTFSANRPAAQLAAIRAFNTRPDIVASVKAIAVVARSKTPASCIHPDRR